MGRWSLRSLVFAVVVSGSFAELGAVSADDTPPAPPAGPAASPPPLPPAPSEPPPVAPPPAAVPVAPAPAAPRVFSIDAAAKAGLLEVSGSRPGGYEEVDLTLISKSSEPFVVDLAGRHLRPTTRDVQRLGLAHPVTPVTTVSGAAPGTVPIALAPGETRTVRMHSCCMDAGKGCPGSADKYVLASAPTSPNVEAVLRWWVDHPKVEQGFVNTAIWQNDPALLTSRPAPERGAGDRAAFPSGKVVRSYAGMAYLLDDGALTSMDREGVRRFHATGIWSIWPGPEGLLAVGVGASGDELWRFGETGDPPWVRVVTVGALPQAVIPGPGGALLLAVPSSAASRSSDLLFLPGRDQGLSAVVLPNVPGGSAVSEPRLFVGAVDRPKGPRSAIAALWLKGTPKQGQFANDAVQASGAKLAVYDVDLRTGKAEHRKTFWNLRDLVVGPAGAFGVNPGQRVVRLDGEHLVEIPPDENIVDVVAVGAERVLALTASGKLLSLDARSGKAQTLPEGAAGRVRPDSPRDAVTVDPKTDQVVWIEDGVAKRWTPGSVEIESIPFK